jgi:flagellar secretion chaperone FliS
VTPSQQALLASRYKSDGMAASSPQKLVVLIYDRLARDLDTAVTAIEAREIEGAHRALVNAQDLVFELQLALDAELWPGAVELESIYDYLLGLLVAANLKKSVELVKRCIDIVAPLRETWTEAYQMIQRGETVAAPNLAALR